MKYIGMWLLGPECFLGCGASSSCDFDGTIALRCKTRASAVQIHTDRGTAATAVHNGATIS